MTIDSKTLVLGFGQCSLDYLGQVGVYPERDQKAELSSFLIQGGGPVATALVTLARLGVLTAMAGMVGGDEVGVRIRSGLEAEGVDCSLLATDSKGTSQVAFIAVDATGHRNIFWHRGSASSTVDVDLGKFTACRVLHLDGLHLLPAIKLAEQARVCGWTTVLDGGSLRPGIEKLLPLIDHLVVSEKFARQVADSDPAAAPQVLIGHGVNAVTVTLGQRGSMTFCADGRRFLQPAFAVDVIDTTGCGDVFHGGYIYGLLQGWDLPEAVRFAAACAALKCRALGGRTAIPDLEEVMDFLAANTED
jgi:sulfofructose kinase